MVDYVDFARVRALPEFALVDTIYLVQPNAGDPVRMFITGDDAVPVEIAAATAVQQLFDAGLIDVPTVAAMTAYLTPAISAGEVRTVPPGTPASVENVGVGNEVVLDFDIPAGAAATLAVGDVTTGTPGSPVVIENVGTPAAAVFDIRIPEGAKGETGLVTDATGFLGAVAIVNDGRKPHTVRASDSVSVLTVNVADAYQGTGTATKGAGRFFLGTLTPQNDDSALCVGRDIVGPGLFSHAFRDESVIKISAAGAYTAYDARHTYATNSDGSKLNHGYAFQASHQFSATGGIDEFAGFVSFPRVTEGRVDRLYHFHVQGMTKTGGSIGQHVGIYISPISGGDGSNYAILQEATDNPNYFGGDTQFGGNITGIPGGIRTVSQITAAAVAVTGAPEFFPTNGGVVFFAADGPAAYGGMRAMSDANGTPKGMVLQRTGGQVLIGLNGNPATGENLEVEGLIGTGEAYRVDGVKVVGNRVTGVAVTVEAIHAALVAHGLIAP